MNPHWLKFIGIALTTVGSLMFTIRATKILSALSFAAKMHEHNISQLLPTHKGDIVIFENSLAHVKRAQGKALLIWGIVLIALGLACQGGSTFLDAAPQVEPGTK
jgi:hypothetical protein